MLKAYEMDDEGTVYAAYDGEHAVAEYENDSGCTVDPNYPRELTKAELDKSFPEIGEYGEHTGDEVSVREWLQKKTVAGFLCGGCN